MDLRSCLPWVAPVLAGPPLVAVARWVEVLAERQWPDATIVPETDAVQQHLRRAATDGNLPPSLILDSTRAGPLLAREGSEHTCSPDPGRREWFRGAARLVLRLTHDTLFGGAAVLAPGDDVPFLVAAGLGLIGTPDSQPDLWERIDPYLDALYTPPAAHTLATELLRMRTVHEGTGGTWILIHVNSPGHYKRDALLARLARQPTPEAAQAALEQEFSQQTLRGLDRARRTLEGAHLGLSDAEIAERWRDYELDHGATAEGLRVEVHRLRQELGLPAQAARGRPKRVKKDTK